MNRTLRRASIRPFDPVDATSIAEQLNDRAIWRNLRDRVPHPYGLADAEAFLDLVAAGALVAFAIDVDGCAVGSIGGQRGDDVHRRTFEVGFWLGRAWHDRGIVSEAVPAFVDWVFDEHADICRVEAQTFGWNAASMRVLEKAGFEREATLRAAVTKDGETTDLVLWSFVRDDRVSR